MRKILLASIIIFPSAAFAAAGGESNNTGCNGVGNANSPCVGQPGQGSAGGAGGNAASRATARASATAGASARATGGSARAAGGAATVQNSVTVAGGGYREQRQAPDVAAPAIWSNNPCVVSASGGVSGLGWGVAIGAGIEDPDCTRRAFAQHLTAMGEREAAREVLCASREVREAFRRVGRPCVADQAPAAVAAPVQSVAATSTARTRPAYCGTLLVRGMITDDCR